MEQPRRPEKRVFPTENTPGDEHTSRHNQYEIDVYKLIDLTKDIPETMVPTDAFKEDLEVVSWHDNNGEIISPQAIIDAYRDAGDFEAAIIAHPELSQHLKKIKNADLSFPVMVFESKIIDGVHRLVKTILEGRPSIKAKIIKQMPEGAIITMHELNQ